MWDTAGYNETCLWLCLKWVIIPSRTDYIVLWVWETELGEIGLQIKVPVKVIEPVKQTIGTVTHMERKRDLENTAGKQFKFNSKKIYRTLKCKSIFYELFNLNKKSLQKGNGFWLTSFKNNSVQHN